MFPGLEFIAFWVADDHVVAGMNVNIWDVVDPIRELITSGRRSNPRAWRIRASRLRRSESGERRRAHARS